MHKLGVLGGLGPMTTVSFINRVIDFTDAKTDQEHIPMIIEHGTDTPDRTEFILGKSDESPLPMMLKSCHHLEQGGATVIAIPCVTAHYFYEDLSKGVNIPIINGIGICVDEFKRMGLKNVGLMATAGTVKSGIFEKPLKDAGIGCIVPDEKRQQLVTDLIYNNVKMGMPVEKDKFREAAFYLRSEGAEVILLGCTELSVIADEWLPEGAFFDMMTELAKESVRLCGKLKK